jgi:hypothetical protein
MQLEHYKRRKELTMQPLLLLIFQRQSDFDLFIVKVGDVVTVNTKGLFEDDQLMDVMKVSHDDVHGFRC